MEHAQNDAVMMFIMRFTLEYMCVPLHCIHREDPFDNIAQKTTIHQITTMQATSKNVLFPGHNHLLTTGIDYPSL